MRHITLATHFDGTRTLVQDDTVPVQAQRTYVRDARTKLAAGVQKVELFALSQPLARTVATEPAPKKRAKKVAE